MKKYWKEVAFTIACIAGLVLIVCGLSALHDKRSAQTEVRRHASYAAWCKYTGNEKGLTYDEYLILVDDGVLSDNIGSK